MNTPTFELDRPPAAFIATLEVDSSMMQAPERRWLWSCLRRRRVRWRFGIIPEMLPDTQDPPVDTQEMGFPDTACIAFRLSTAPGEVASSALLAHPTALRD
jgi:hypothetical protein